MFGKVKSVQNRLVEVRMVLWSPLKPHKPIKTIKKQNPGITMNNSICQHRHVPGMYQANGNILARALAFLPPTPHTNFGSSIYIYLRFY